MLKLVIAFFTVASLAHATPAPLIQPVSDAELATMINTIREASPEARSHWRQYLAEGGLAVTGMGAALMVMRASRVAGRFLLRWGTRLSILGFALNLLWPNNNTPDDDFSALLRSEGGLEEILKHDNSQIIALADRDPAFRFTLQQTYQLFLMARDQRPLSASQPSH